MERRGLDTPFPPLGLQYLRAAFVASSSVMPGFRSDISEMQTILRSNGRNIFYTGKSGAGEAAKIANNLMGVVNMMTSFEAVSLAKKAGLVNM